MTTHPTGAESTPRAPLDRTPMRIAFDEIARLTERNRALEALVEAAYIEGYGAGYPMLDEGFNPSLHWERSSSRRALTNGGPDA